MYKDNFSKVHTQFGLHNRYNLIFKIFPLDAFRSVGWEKKHWLTDFEDVDTQTHHEDGKDGYHLVYHQSSSL